jgi:hypothetical protein
MQEHVCLIVTVASVLLKTQACDSQCGAKVSRIAVAGSRMKVLPNLWRTLRDLLRRCAKYRQS